MSAAGSLPASLRSVLDALPDGTAVIEDGMLRHVNPALAAMAGRSAAELEGTSAVALVAARDRDAVAARLDPGRDAAAAAVPLVCRLVRPGGAEFPAELVVRPLAVEGGAFLLCLWRDLTRRLLAEAELRQLKKAVETMQLGLTIADLEHRIVYVNPADAGMHGYTVAELIGQDARVFAPGDRRRTMTLEELRAMRSWVREVENVRRDGSRFPVRLLSDVVKNAAGDPVAVVTVCEDITERRRVEEALRHSEERYRAIVEHASYGIFRSNAGGQFVSVNRALARMLGYESAAELLRVDFDTTVLADPEQHRLLARHVVEDRAIEGLELEWRRKDGLPVLVRLSGRVVRTAAGAFDGFELIVEDVTERRELEEQLRRAQKMEAIGQLTGGIAHDFNNLLTVIAANADLLEAALPPEPDGLVAEAREIQHAAQRGKAMVRKLLAFSRHERLTLERVELGELVSQQIQVLRRLLPADIEISLALPPGLPAVQADPGAVEQILLNLATNARDAMPHGGLLRIQMGRTLLDEDFRATVGWGEPGSYVFVSVSDTGVGMDRETLSRIFEPFFTTKPKEGGTGLGMAMVYGLMKQHRGFINVYSEQREGTTVKLLFPAAPPAAVADAARNAPAGATPAPGGTETILVAEDEAPILRATKRVLEKYGYRVLAAGDGEQALELYRQHAAEVALVLSDLVMPRVNGRELLRALRAQRAPVRFLITSGYSARDVRESASMDPDVPFLNKPWTVTDLLVRVRDCLDGR
jgi:PAS domain S-box-containing protein